MTPGGETTLDNAPAGTAAVIRNIEAGCSAASRLHAMGLLPGVPVRVVRNDPGGPIVLGVHGGKIMLGRGLAARVRVRVCARGRSAESPARAASA